jgi:hypothetical protein
LLAQWARHSRPQTVPFVDASELVPRWRCGWTGDALRKNERAVVALAPRDAVVIPASRPSRAARLCHARAGT